MFNFRAASYNKFELSWVEWHRCHHAVYQPMGGDTLRLGRYTVGLASHWPRVTDISDSLPWDWRPWRRRWAPAYAILVSDAVWDRRS